MTSIAPAWIATPAPQTYVNSVDVSADGSRIVAGTFWRDYAPPPANRVFGTFCYDGSGTLQWAVPVDTTCEGVYWTAIAPKGNVAASGGATQHDPAGPLAGFLQIIDVASGAVTYENLKIEGRVSAVAFSEDGSTLVACAGWAVYLASLSGSACVRGLLPAQVESQAVSVAISPDGRWIVTGTTTGVVHLFQNAGGSLQPVRQWTMPQGLAWRSVCFSATGDWFAACGGSQGEAGIVALFNRAAFETGGQPQWTQALPRISYAVALAGGDAGTPPAVIVSSNVYPGGEVTRYDTTASGAQAVWTFKTPGAPNGIAVRADGARLAVADGYPENTPGHFTCASADDGSVAWTFTTGNMSWPIVFTDAGAIAAGSDDGHVYFFTP